MGSAWREAFELMNIEIKKSLKLQELRVIVVAVIAVLALILASFIMQTLRANLPFEAPLLRWMVRFVIVGVAVAVVVMAWFQDRFKTYTLEDDKLIISSHYIGKGGNTQIITLNSKTVTQLSLNQTLLGRSLDYGTISIEVDSFSKKELHKLEHIDNPRNILKEIDAHMHQARKSAK